MIKGLSMRSLLLYGIILWTMVASTAAWAENRITGIRSGGNSELARLVIETSTEIPLSMLLLSEPHRLVIDMPETRWRVEGRSVTGGLETSLLKGYRFGNPAAGVSRLVIDLDGPAIPVEAFRLPPNGRGHRLVIDISQRGETAFQLAARAFNQQGNLPLKLDQPSPEQSDPGQTILLPEQRPDRANTGKSASGLLLPLPRPRRNDREPSRDKWVVFIDAGHGGKDPGAIGVSGVNEKHITLKAALELAENLNATGRVNALLSRKGDQYHRLRKRIQLARDAKSDVFISLHADAAPNKKAMGVSVFTLSDTASDKEAAFLARQENKADLIGGPDLDTTDPVVTSTLLGMFQRESMNQSSVLAATIIREFDGISTSQRGHRFAGFAVLKSPDMPSVLVEMGFLTNREDEKRLKSAAYRQDLMKRLARAIVMYLEENSSLE